MSTSLQTKVKFLSGFSNKTRLQILDSIREGEKTVTDIVEQIQSSQSNISQHLSCLKACGLILSRREGKYVYYRLRNEKIADLLTMFDLVLEDVEQNIESCPNHFINSKQNLIELTEDGRPLNGQKD